MKKRIKNFRKIKTTSAKAKSIKRSVDSFPTIYYYLIFIFVFDLAIILTPILLINKSPYGSLLFSFFSPFCHQMFQRSLCLSSSYVIGNCDISSWYIFQFPVCARDTAFYFAMLIGGLFLLLLNKKDEVEVPSFIYLFILIIPLAVDGLTQLIGLRESTNELRLITGFLAGISIPFYLIPLINRIIYLKKHRLN